MNVLLDAGEVIVDFALMLLLYVLGNLLAAIRLYSASSFFYVQAIRTGDNAMAIMERYA